MSWRIPTPAPALVVEAFTDVAVGEQFIDSASAVLNGLFAGPNAETQDARR